MVPPLRPWLALGLIFALSGSAGADLAGDPKAVIERFATATGGRAAIAAERALRVKGRVSAFGFEGAVEAWSARPDRRASSTVLGPFTLRDGFDGTVAWRVDQNGKLSRLDGKDLEAATASAWFENEMWLLPDGGGSLRMAGTERDSGTYALLEVTPPVGRPRTLWFDAETGLLMRTVQKEDERTVVARVLEYRTLAGRLRANRTEITIEGMPLNTVRLTVDSVWVVDADPRVFAPPDQDAQDSRFLRPGGPARLPFEYAVHHLWLPVSVNGGAPEPFLLDTGASVTVLDSAWAAAHGFATAGRVGVGGAGAQGSASFARVDSLRVTGPDGGGIALYGQKVAVLSLNPHLEPFFWRTCAGVLGYDFISRFVLEVDYDARRLTLHEPRTFSYAGPGAAIPLNLAGNIPVMKAKVGGLEGQFRLDIGSGSTVDLHRPFVERHGLLAQARKTVEILGGGFGGTFASRMCRMSEIEIGPFSWKDPLVALSGAATGGLASEDYAGNIGNRVLDRFKCTFDYERRVVHLEPGKRFAERDRFTLAGMQIAKLDGTFRAMQVLAGSAAEAAGLRAGDEVVRLDGRPIETYTQDDLIERFENGAPGTRHRIEIRRDGKGKKVTLRLREIL